MGLFDIFKNPAYQELTPEQDAVKLRALKALAKKFYKHVQPGTEAQLLITRDKKNPALMTEWTVASEPTPDYTEGDEWKLIANGYNTLDKIKENALLIALTNVDKKGFKGTAYTGAQITPKATIGGVPIKPLFYGSTPIDMKYRPSKKEVQAAEEASFLSGLGIS